MHNERIGDNKIYLLAKEAGLIEFEQLAWNPELGSPTYESVVKTRKFAELIVRECAEVSFKHWERHKECSAHFSIREHFGVEE